MGLKVIDYPNTVVLRRVFSPLRDCPERSRRDLCSPRRAWKLKHAELHQAQSEQSQSSPTTAQAHPHAVSARSIETLPATESSISQPESIRHERSPQE